MGNQEVKELNMQEEGQLIKAAFLLSQQPISYQISIHVNNLLLTYSNGKQGNLIRKRMVAGIKATLTNPEKIANGTEGVRITQLIEYYGVEKMREWFTMVYGWSFDQKAG